METSLPKRNAITFTHQQAREQGRDLLRRNVIETASRLLVQEGPDALTVRRIAQELDCSTKILYTMFHGKDDVANALYIEGCERLRQELARVPKIDNPTEYLYAMGWVYWNFALENPGYYGVMFGCAIPNFHPSDTSIHMATTAFETLIEVVQRYMDQGILAKDDARIIAKTLWASLHGVASLQLLGHFATLEDARDVSSRTIHAVVSSLIPDEFSR